MFVARGALWSSAMRRLAPVDFSLPSLSAAERAVFVHEIGHVWQVANATHMCGWRFAPPKR